MTKWTDNFNHTLTFSDTCGQVSLVANTVQTYTVPGTPDKPYQILFAYTENSNVFVGYNFTPVVPGSGLSTTNGNEEFRPIKRYVKGGDVLSFITPDTGGAYLGFSLRSLPH